MKIYVFVSHYCNVIILSFCFLLEGTDAQRLVVFVVALVSLLDICLCPRK